MKKKFTEWLDEDDSVIWTRMLTSRNDTDRRIAREFLSASCAHVCGVAQKDPCFEGDPYKVFKKHPSKRVRDMAYTMIQYKDPSKTISYLPPEPSKPRKLSKAEKEHRRKQVIKWRLKRAGLNAIMLLVLAGELIGGLYLGEYVTNSCPEHARPFMGTLFGILIAQILLITFMVLREDLVKENSKHPYDTFR